MLTYDLLTAKGPLYKNLYQFIKSDIVLGRLEANAKMPSKRTLAKNLGISTITIENAYNQLIDEGYMYSVEKKGYFIANIHDFSSLSSINVGKFEESKKLNLKIKIPQTKNCSYDFSSNSTDSANFPFSVWAKLTREIISLRQKELLEVSPCGGVEELRTAIANHLSSFRGMAVDPNQIIVGAGTEYLYGLLIKLLGKDKIFCIENPGYKKLMRIYNSNGARCTFANLDSQGILVSELKKTNASIAHISPNHHFPTGITMPVSRRYELLAWANEQDERYIIEDDYDSEFRLNGNPIPPMGNIDASGKVIYMNTFSKSLTSTIRISYMVLPERLANKFYETLSFYSCTVSTFEQYTLAAFISRGYFEKHINRMRIHYGKKRTAILEILRQIFTDDECKIIENDSGLHFLLEFNTPCSDREIKQHLEENGIKISTISDYEMGDTQVDSHRFILNYSSLDISGLNSALLKIKEII